MKNNTYLLDHHQRSHYDTITIVPKGMINWVILLNNSQLENSLNSLLEKHHVSIFPNQPNPNPIQSVIDQGNLIARKMFVVKGETSRSHEIDDKRLHEELGSSDRRGKPVKISEDIRAMHAHDGAGEPVKSSSSTHIVKEQFVPAEHRDTASSNADNQFNHTTDKQNIDFNIPGVPNSTVKRSHGVNVHNLIQRIENHPQRQALQSDLQQHRAFNPFSKESQEVIKAAGNTELCEILDVEQKSTMQSMPRELGRWHRLLHVRAPLAREERCSRIKRQINSKRSVERNNTRTFTVDLSVIHGSERL